MSRAKVPEGERLVAARYAPQRPQGKRVPGWSDVNVVLLASDAGVSYRFLLAVLCGRRNSTASLLQRVANCLGIPAPQLLDRVELAKRLKILEAAQSPDKATRRRARSKLRAIRSL